MLLSIQIVDSDGRKNPASSFFLKREHLLNNSLPLSGFWSVCFSLMFESEHEEIPIQ
jgi:hypothetical protein